VTAVASRTDAGKQITLDCLPIVVGLVGNGASSRLVRILAFAFLATITVLKEARFAFYNLHGLDILRHVFSPEPQDKEEKEVLRYAAQTVTTMAEWPKARAEMQGLRPALEKRRASSSGSAADERIFERTANQLAWNP
jgi:hypothetical protein